mgnify:CR=1 FL=1
MPATAARYAVSPDGLQVYAWTGDEDGNYSLIRVLLGVGTTVDEPDQASGVVTGTVKATDPEGDPLTYALGDGASHGTATVHPQASPGRQRLHADPVPGSGGRPAGAG